MASAERAYNGGLGRRGPGAELVEGQGTKPPETESILSIFIQNRAKTKS